MANQLSTGTLRREPLVTVQTSSSPVSHDTELPADTVPAQVHQMTEEFCDDALDGNGNVGSEMELSSRATYQQAHSSLELAMNAFQGSLDS